MSVVTGPLVEQKLNYTRHSSTLTLFERILYFLSVFRRQDHIG